MKPNNGKTSQKGKDMIQIKPVLKRPKTWIIKYNKGTKLSILHKLLSFENWWKSS